MSSDSAFVISILNEKGGVGKTTLATNLYRAIVKDESASALFVDSDPQGTARDHHSEAEGELFDMIGLDRPTIDKDVKKFLDMYDYLIIDGKPGIANSDAMMMAKTVSISDLILIPIQPSPYDVTATQRLVELVHSRMEVDPTLKAAFVITRAIANTNISKEVFETVKAFDLPVLNSMTTQYVGFAEAPMKGTTAFDEKPYGNEGVQIRKIKNEIMEMLHGSSERE